MLTTLPASWGSSQDVLPTLRELTLVMQVLGQLPTEWCNGFHRLTSLIIIGKTSSSSQSSAAVAAPDSGTGTAHAVSPPSPVTAHLRSDNAYQRCLPAQWATGFPELIVLNLVHLDLAGSIPDAWQSGGFPNLGTL